MCIPNTVCVHCTLFTSCINFKYSIKQKHVYKHHLFGHYNNYDNLFLYVCFALSFINKVIVLSLSCIEVQLLSLHDSFPYMHDCNNLAKMKALACRTLAVHCKNEKHQNTLIHVHKHTQIYKRNFQLKSILQM